MRDRRYTARVQEALAAAERTADASGHEYVGTEHLLLALSQQDSPAAHVLSNLGVTSDRLRAETRRLMGWDAT